MDVYFGTVVRSAPVERGGELVRLRWADQQLLARRAIFPENPRVDHDPNPRGNSRGCRGIAVVGDQVVAADYHTLRLYSRDLEYRRSVSHGLMVGLHEICVTEGDAIWVSSTAIDAAFKYDLRSGRLLESSWPRQHERLQQALGVDPVELDPEQDHRLRYLDFVHKRASRSHLHLNAVAVYEGQLLALFHAYGAIVNLSTDEVLCQAPELRHAHNLLILPGGRAAINSTYRRTVHICSLKRGRLERSFNLLDYPWVRSIYRRAHLQYLVQNALRVARLRSSAVARPLFVRGLDCVDSQLFVGLSPAAIVSIDWQSGAFLAGYQYSQELSVCIHGLKVVP
jgi:hypothetical protein